jgi:hypothetical protein
MRGTLNRGIYSSGCSRKVTCPLYGPATCHHMFPLFPFFLFFDPTRTASVRMHLTYDVTDCLFDFITSQKSTASDCLFDFITSQKSTASIGRFDAAIANEPKIKTPGVGKKRKFEPNVAPRSDRGSEKAKLAKLADQVRVPALYSEHVSSAHAGLHMPACTCRPAHAGLCKLHITVIDGTHPRSLECLMFPVANLDGECVGTVSRYALNRPRFSTFVTLNQRALCFKPPLLLNKRRLSILGARLSIPRKRPTESSRMCSRKPSSRPSRPSRGRSAALLGNETHDLLYSPSITLKDKKNV